MTTIVYVLKLVEGNYYIVKTYKQHQSGHGSQWTRKYSVDCIFDLCSDASQVHNITSK